MAVGTTGVAVPIAAAGSTPTARAASRHSVACFACGIVIGAFLTAALCLGSESRGGDRGVESVRGMAPPTSCLPSVTAAPTDAPAVERWNATRRTVEAPISQAVAPQDQRRSSGPGHVEVPIAVNPMLAMLRYDADSMFVKLLAAPVKRRGLVVEVGSWDGEQALAAYQAGYQVLVLEPSPVNVARVRLKLRRGLLSTARRVNVIQAAASDKAGPVQFWVNKYGSPGDHVTLDGKVHVGEEENYNKIRAFRTLVEAARLEDIVGPNRRVYILKVDVQGHELHVFRGARRLFEERRVAFAIFEYHPKQLGPEAPTLPVELNRLGYDTYFLGPSWSRGEGFSDEWFAFPTAPADFAASFRTQHAKGLGEWTDLLAVCRTCVSDNQMEPGKTQLFSVEELQTFAEPQDETLPPQQSSRPPTKADTTAP